MPTVFSYVLGRPAIQQTIEEYELPAETVQEVTPTILNDTPASPSDVDEIPTV